MIEGRIYKNAGYLFISDVVVRLSAALAGVIAARYLGPEQFGQLAVALAFSQVTYWFSDLGLNQCFIREGTRPDADLPALLGSSIKVRGLFTVATMLVSTLLIIALYPAPAQPLMLMLALPMTVNGALQSFSKAYFQVRQQMRYNALISAAGSVTIIIGLLSAVLLRLPLLQLALAYVLGGVAAALLSVAWLRGKINYRAPFDRRLLDGLWAFTATGGLAVIVPQLGPLLLERVTSAAQVGYFAAAFRIPALLYVLPNTIASAFYPRMFELARVDEARRAELAVMQMRVMGQLGVVMALPLWLCAPQIIGILFGEQWAAHSVPALRILSGTILLQCLGTPQADTLTTIGRQHMRAVAQLVAALCGAAAYILLGARYGALGGALAALILLFVQQILLALFNPHSVRMLAASLPRVAAAAALALAAGLGLRALLPGWGLIVASPFAALAAALLCEPELRNVGQRLLRLLRRRRLAAQAAQAAALVAASEPILGDEAEAVEQL